MLQRTKTYRTCFYLETNWIWHPKETELQRRYKRTERILRFSLARNECINATKIVNYRVRSHHPFLTFRSL